MAGSKYSADFILDLSKGLVRDHSVVNIFGYNSDISSTIITPWELTTDYEFPPSALPMTVTSSSGATDNGIQVKIVGLDSSYDALTETVTLNAASPPVTISSFFRINTTSTIAGGNAIGTITVTNGAGTYDAIRPMHGISQGAFFTTGRKQNLFINRISAFSIDNVSVKPGFFVNWSRLENGQVFQTARSGFGGFLDIQRHVPFQYGEKTDIKLQLGTTSGTHEMSVFSEGILQQKL
jgi:hypothetical protein